MNTKTRVHPCNCALQENQESSQALPRNGLFIAFYCNVFVWVVPVESTGNDPQSKLFGSPLRSAQCGTVWHRVAPFGVPRSWSTSACQLADMA